MKVDVSLVTEDLFDCAFEDPEIQKHLTRIAELTTGRLTAEDLIKLVRDGIYQLWVVFDTDERSLKTHGIVLTELKQYPRKKFLCIQHCTGRQGSLQDSGVDTIAILEKFALDEGCAGVEFVGRFGWERFAERNLYVKRSVVYQKIFE